MTRDEMIQQLKRFSPIVTQVTGTEDMGFEFSAVVPNGVIYSELGMLLDYSDGEWPPNEWEGKTDDECQKLFREFLLDDSWEVTPWADLSDEEIEEWLDDARVSSTVKWSL